MGGKNSKDDSEILSRSSNNLAGEKSPGGGIIKSPTKAVIRDWPTA